MNNGIQELIICCRNASSLCTKAECASVRVPCVHCKKEMVILTLLRLSQLQLNDIILLPTLSYPILLRLKACGQSVGCLQ